ncbi:hypothetical protein [Peribacillus glennii]|uniref:hypothetical protein n=1 Tax=Peribacillus glennii TaxID=2303991 RepID=UPI0018F20D75|nr:hypothetical protein [Peribacillus glennii]
MKYDSKEIRLAEKIIQLDILRDQLLEELMELAGTRTHELLRTVQNDGIKGVS